MLEGVGEVTIQQGERESLTTSADESLLADVKTNVNDGLLRLNIAPINFLLSFGARKEIKFDITVKNLELLQLSGAGQMRAALKQEKLKVVLSGAGSIEMNGALQSLVLVLSGTGSFKGDDLVCQHAEVTVSGAGSAYVGVQETLQAVLSGVGSVHYCGSPSVTSKISGLGSIHQIAQ
ncbi:MAG: GIN domain-containing protein [Anaerolineae bacterium]